MASRFIIFINILFQRQIAAVHEEGMQEAVDSDNPLLQKYHQVSGSETSDQV